MGAEKEKSKRRERRHMIKAGTYNAIKTILRWGFSTIHKYSSIMNARKDEVQETLQKLQILWINISGFLSRLLIHIGERRMAYSWNNVCDSVQFTCLFVMVTPRNLQSSREKSRGKKAVTRWNKQHSQILQNLFVKDLLRTFQLPDTRQMASEITASLPPLPNETHSPFSRWIYIQHFGIKSWRRRKKNNYSQESSPSHFSHTVTTSTLLSSVMRAGSDVGEKEFSLFLTVAGNPKHTRKLSIFLHSKQFMSQSSSTSLAALQLQPRMAHLATMTLPWWWISGPSS